LLPGLKDRTDKLLSMLLCEVALLDYFMIGVVYSLLVVVDQPGIETLTPQVHTHSVTVAHKLMKTIKLSIVH